MEISSISGVSFVRWFFVCGVPKRSLSGGSGCPTGGDCEPWHIIITSTAATPSRGDEALQPPCRSRDATVAVLLVRRRDDHHRPGCMAGEHQAEDVRPAR